MLGSPTDRAFHAAWQRLSSPPAEYDQAYKERDYSNHAEHAADDCTDRYACVAVRRCARLVIKFRCSPCSLPETEITPVAEVVLTADPDSEVEVPL